MTSLRPWLALFRPGNALIAAAAVWLGWISQTLRPDWGIALWGSLSMLLMVSAGNAHNDARDVETDRVNRPHRPLPAGDLRLGPVRIASTGLYVIAVALAWFGSPLHGLLAGVMAVMLWIYNRFLKATPLAGNLVVALLCALAVYFVELPMLIDFPLEAHDSLPAALFAFIATFAREVAKDAEDYDGDRAQGLRTFAVTSGLSAARKLAFALSAILFAALPLPVVFKGYNLVYALCAAFLAAPLLAALLVDLARPDANFTRAQKLLKWVMLAGMVSLLAGVVTRDI
jgi:4-hydroxybenzoate polyprenyltransferase